jgi:hypothetical protein
MIGHEEGASFLFCSCKDGLDSFDAGHKSSENINQYPALAVAIPDID